MKNQAKLWKTKQNMKIQAHYEDSSELWRTKRAMKNEMSYEDTVSDADVSRTVSPSAS